MYALKDFGSFHVGGRIVTVSGQEKRSVAFTPSLVLEYDPNGEFLVEQVYVQYFIPAERKFPHPLVLLHGGGLTGACWETTPDGRPGWLHDFLRQGFAVYVIDNVERGRSGFCALEGVWEGEPRHAHGGRSMGPVPLRAARGFRRRQAVRGPSAFRFRRWRVSSASSCRAGPRHRKRRSGASARRSGASAPQCSSATARAAISAAMRRSKIPTAFAVSSAARARPCPWTSR